MIGRKNQQGVTLLEMAVVLALATAALVVVVWIFTKLRSEAWIRDHAGFVMTATSTIESGKPVRDFGDAHAYFEMARRQEQPWATSVEASLWRIMGADANGLPCTSGCPNIRFELDTSSVDLMSRDRCTGLLAAVGGRMRTHGVAPRDFSIEHATATCTSSVTIWVATVR